MVTLYGMRNCDTVRKAIKWLDGSGVDYSFYDYKKQSLSVDVLRKWVSDAGVDIVVNRKSATWRGLADDSKRLVDEKGDGWEEVVLSNSSLIKRPVIDKGDARLFGFEVEKYRDFLRNIG